MGNQDLAAAMRRAEAVFQRRPDMGVHDDAPAAARWQSGTRVVASHPNGAEIASDMPCELGGTGDRITPGWLFRAGIASCTTTTIAMAAAAAGIELAALEVQVGSRSDTRALLGMTQPNGERVCAAPSDFQLIVRIAAHGVDAERLRALVAEGMRRSPITNALQNAMPTALRVDIATA
jgi:uncharacterized OsmC-like protein